MNHAIYFVGYKVVGNGATELLGLDPHRYCATSDDDDDDAFECAFMYCILLPPHLFSSLLIDFLSLFHLFLLSFLLASFPSLA